MSLVDRLPHLDKDQLVNLLANAKRLQDAPGPQGEAAKELLPAVEAELARRAPRPAVKSLAARKPAATKTAAKAPAATGNPT